MSLTSTQSLFQYAIASLGQAFTPACPVQNTSDFVVTFSSATTLLDTVLTLNVDYTVTGSATAGVILAPTVTLEGTGLHYAVGGRLTIQRKNPFTQPTTYLDGTKYLAATSNNSLDWLGYSIQALNDIAVRSLRLPATAAALPEMALTTRAGNIIGFDASGNLTFYTPTASIVPTNQLTEAVLSIAALKALLVSGLNGRQVNVAGYYTPGDGGGGLFAFSSTSVATPNGGTVIAPTVGSGNWLRSASPLQVNIRQFGAKGDNSTNDTAAIAVAFVYALATPGSFVYVPPGTYLTDTISFTGAAGLTIYGDGAGVSILKGRAATRVLVVGNSVHVNVRGLTFDGSCTTRTAGQQAVTMDASKSSFTYCEIINSGEFAFYAGTVATQVTDLIVSNNYIHDCYADGIHFEWVTVGLIENNLILRVDDDCIALYWNASGIANRITVVGNYMESRNDLGTTTGRGIIAVRAFNCMIASNLMRGIKQSGIWLHNEAGSRVQSVWVMNNVIKLAALNSGFGIAAYATTDCVIEGNTIENPLGSACIDIADWQNLVIRGGVLRQANNIVSRGIHAEESAGWAASWDKLVIADVVIEMQAANNIQCIYLGPDASVTMNIISISGIVGSMVTAGDYISLTLARLGTLAKVVNNIKLQAANTISPAASSGVLTVAGNN